MRLALLVVAGLVGSSCANPSLDLAYREGRVGSDLRVYNTKAEADQTRQSPRPPRAIEPACLRQCMSIVNQCMAAMPSGTCRKQHETCLDSCPSATSNADQSPITTQI